jgi:hypothetical protein
MHVAHDLRQLLHAADTAGANLPADVDAVARHALDLGGIPTATASEAATGLLDHLGDRDAFIDALTDALDGLARSGAATALTRALQPRAHAKAWELVVTRREKIADAFGKALKPHLATLTEQAPRLPATLNVHDLDQLTPQQFAAWRACQPAAEALEAAAAGIRSLYPVAADSMFTPRIAARLCIVEPPAQLTTPAQAHRFLDAIEGRRTLGAGNAMASVNHDLDGFWPARVADTGGSFTWAGPADTIARANRLRTACTQRPRTPAGAA